MKKITDFIKSDYFKAAAALTIAAILGVKGLVFYSGFATGIAVSKFLKF